MTIEPNLFERHTPPELVEKLNRELDRYMKARTRDEREDHMMNFVWTAWHLVERTWYGMQTLHADERKRLEQALGTSWRSKNKFRDWAKQQCPELGACRQLSNIAKHLSRKDIAPDEVAVDVTARPTMSASTASLRDIERVEYWSHEINYGGSTRVAEDVFRPVLEFWTGIMGYGLRISW